MAHVSDLIASDIGEYLEQHEHKGLLRFITCGSVDDGKSTLIGRLLHDSKMLFEDQLAAVESDSRKWGTQGGDIDFTLLVDGLAAEREQGITIDVAYRFFSTDRRKFIVADTPGHEQYTRNMVTGASTADVAVILIDARKGVLTQTRRHSFLVSLIGIRQVVLAINKMDLVDFDEATCRRIDADYREFGAQIGLANITTIPLSGLKGDNIATRSAAMPWYEGPALMEFLETCPLDELRLQRGPLRLPVQWVNRPNLDFRGFCGVLASGTVRPGDRVRVQPSGRESVVERIVGIDGDRELAVAGESVTLTLRDEIDISRGDVISAADAPAEVADQFECHLVWMDDEPLLPGRPYLLKLGARTVNATVTEIKHKVNVNTLEHLATKPLALNEIGVCNLGLDGDNVRHGLNRHLGFTDVDRVENIRRVAEVAKLMADAGLIVITSFISPFSAERQLARNLLEPGEFIEVFVDVPLEVAESRDVKGLYAKARRGQLPHFTGIDSPYEAPEDAEVHLPAAAITAEQAADRVLDKLREMGVVKG